MPDVPIHALMMTDGAYRQSEDCCCEGFGTVVGATCLFRQLFAAVIESCAGYHSGYLVDISVAVRFAFLLSTFVDHTTGNQRKILSRS